MRNGMRVLGTILTALLVSALLWFTAILMDTDATVTAPQTEERPATADEGGFPGTPIDRWSPTWMPLAVGRSNE